MGPNSNPFLSSLICPFVPSFTFAQCVAEIFTEHSERSAEVHCDEVFLRCYPGSNSFIHTVQVTPAKWLGRKEALLRGRDAWDLLRCVPTVESNKKPAKPWNFFAALFHRKVYLDEVIHKRHLTVLLDLVKRDSIHHRFDESTVIWGHHNSIPTKNKRRWEDVNLQARPLYQGEKYILSKLICKFVLLTA